jgi:hypothetical protein
LGSAAVLAENAFAFLGHTYGVQVRSASVETMNGQGSVARG